MLKQAFLLNIWSATWIFRDPHARKRSSAIGGLQTAGRMFDNLRRSAPVDPDPGNTHGLRRKFSVETALSFSKEPAGCSIVLEGLLKIYLDKLTYRPFLPDCLNSAFGRETAALTTSFLFPSHGFHNRATLLRLPADARLLNNTQSTDLPLTLAVS